MLPRQMNFTFQQSVVISPNVPSPKNLLAVDKVQCAHLLLNTIMPTGASNPQPCRLHAVDVRSFMSDDSDKIELIEGILDGEYDSAIWNALIARESSTWKGFETFTLAGLDARA
jgi:hypothetical protein